MVHHKRSGVPALSYLQKLILLTFKLQGLLLLLVQLAIEKCLQSTVFILLHRVNMALVLNIKNKHKGELNFYEKFCCFSLALLPLSVNTAD